MAQNSDTLFNNEAIASIAVLAVLKEARKVPLENVALILPMLLHKPLVSHVLKRHWLAGIEDLVAGKLELFLNFSERFHSFLSLTVNILIILDNLGLVYITNDHVYFNEPENLGNHYLGNRAQLISRAAGRISHLFRLDPVSLYFTLKVEL